MLCKVIFTACFLVANHFAIAQSSFAKSRDRTALDVREWAEENKNSQTWHGWILYQGSDSAKHHFISRLSDGWVWFDIRRADLALKEERQYRTTSSAPFGYYYVDATKDFVKVKDY